MSSDNAGDSTELTKVREILEAIGKILEKNDYYDDNKYTVFTAIESERLEVTTHTPFLYELLNPEGSHGLKRVFLESFFKIVLHEHEYYDPGTTMVFKQYTIPKDAKDTGIIDLYIESTKACYPIEIKIDAPDQPTQIQRYYTFAKNNKKHFKVFYLTPYGSRPSKESMGCLGNNNENVICISFAKNIYSWIIECLKLAEAQKALEVANAINQYKILIEKLTGVEQEKGYMADIRKIIKDNYLSAVNIIRNIDYVRTEKLKQFIKDLGKYIENNWKLKIVEDEESEFNNYYKRKDGKDEESEFNNYYKGKDGKDVETYPGVSFVLKTMPEKHITVYFRLEIDKGHLGYGVHVNEECLPLKRNDVIKVFPDSSDWKNIVKNHKYEEKGWLWWNNLNGRFDANFLDFHDDDYVKLFDAKEYNSMLDKIKEAIDENMPSIIDNGVPMDGPHDQF